MSRDAACGRNRVVVLAWVPVPDTLSDVLRAEHPGAEIEMVEWHSVSSLRRFAREQNALGTDTLYLLVADLDRADQAPFLAAAAMFVHARRRLMDLHGKTMRLSCLRFWWRYAPLIPLQLLWAAAVVILNGTVLAILGLNVVQRRLRLPERLDRAEDGLLPRLVFLWAELPDALFDFRVGGEISHIVGFLSGVRRLDVAAEIVCARPIEHRDIGVPCGVIDERRLPVWPGEVRQMAYNWKLLMRMGKRVAGLGPCVIYHRASAFSFAGVLLALRYRLPLVVEINSSEVWKAENWHPVRFTGILRLTERVCVQYATRVAVVSAQVGEYLVANGAPRDRIVVNPNGVDPDVFSPERRTRDNDLSRRLDGKIVVGFAGSFAPYHGILILAESLRHVSRAVPNIHYLMMGDGPLRKRFEEILTRDGVCEAATLTGRVAHERMPELLGCCHILASPHQNMADGSTFFGSPTKIFEYMALGRAIVASRVGQLAEILDDGETALLVDPGDAEALAAAIVRLAADDGLRNRLGANARKLVMERYTWERNAARVLAPVLPLDERPAGTARCQRRG